MMPTLSPSTLTQVEQRTILRATSKNVRDHLIISIALGTVKLSSETKRSTRAARSLSDNQLSYSGNGLA